MAAAAAPLSLAATGLSAATSLSQGSTASAAASIQAQNALNQGAQQNAYDTYTAKMLSDQAEYGRVSAAQTDTDLRLQLQDTLASMSAISGAQGADPNSPTNAAILNRTETVSDINRNQTVSSIEAQVAQDTLASRYYKSAGIQALQIGQANANLYMANAQNYQTGGLLGAAGSLFQGLAGAVPKFT